MKSPKMIFLFMSSLMMWPVMLFAGIGSAQTSVNPLSIAPLDSPQVRQAELSLSPLQFTPPRLPDRGRPGGRSEGGASRGGCDVAGQSPLTALIPATSSAIDGEISSGETSSGETSSREVSAQSLSNAGSAFTLTTKAQPSFWFYVPYSLAETPIEFVLQDENNNTLYRSTASDVGLSATADQGIVQVMLPEAAPALEVGAAYRWFFMAYCESDSPSFVEGWIERSPLAPSLSASLDSATPREQTLLYAQNGFWQETLTLAAERYRQNPSNPEYTQDWESLLASVNLSHLSEQPLLDCCTFESSDFE
ncbi:MAG: DUF928 domain-containing protein [Cyanobacteria bacterium J06649_4]